MEIYQNNKFVAKQISDLLYTKFPNKKSKEKERKVVHTTFFFGFF